MTCWMLRTIPLHVPRVTLPPIHQPFCCAMAPGTESSGSKPTENIPVHQPTICKCLWCPKTFKNTQGRGGHMAKNHTKLMEMRKQCKKNMVDKNNNLHKTKVRHVIPVKANNTLPQEVGSSGCSSLFPSMDDKKQGMDDMGDMDNNKLDLTLKL
ncbi:hypothetical protein HU200_060042 [Digitaria exilis]|uniref:C2H2-type domain-containing protein n=1 Tax=Digitaria exilis TaxID=1010633 RepID=A0A835AK50_9POAL|nr:hypothetical protein HU200_060042 [Digitaria exilis]